MLSSWVLPAAACLYWAYRAWLLTAVLRALTQTVVDHPPVVSCEYQLLPLLLLAVRPAGTG
jgi:hypothetical protein